MDNSFLSLGLRANSNTEALSLPFPDFDASHVVPAVDALIASSKEALAAVAAESELTWDRVMGAFESATEHLDLVMVLVGHLESVTTSPALRAAHEEAQVKGSAFYSSISLDPGLFRVLRAYSATDEAKGLPPLRARLLKKTLDAFRRNGAELEGEDKKRLEAIATELAQKTTRYSQNVLDETNAFELVIEDASRLAGLPQSALDAARRSAESKGLEGYRFTLQAPSYIAVMTYVDEASIRESLWRAYNTRASQGERDNRGLVCDILRLRKEKARLLGFEDFADFVLAERMAKSGAKATSFVDDLRDKTREAFVRECAELAQFRQELEGAEAPVLQPWDVAYYGEKLRKARFDFDDEALRPYFAVPSVLDGLFDLATRLYGVRIEAYDAPVWHESVRCFGIYDGHRLVSTFYVDLYPRETKRGGAWMNAFVYGTGGDPHIGLFCANVTEPSADAPALLTHREVETLFHEFGHLLHHALSDVSERSLGGTNVAWDFVELPSQIMENFCWERVSLDLFARHHETGEPIPEALFEKLRAARTFRAASGQMRQLGLGTVDLRLHREFDPTEGPEAMATFARDVLAAHAPTDVPEDYAMICGFTHLFASPVGYAAAYYSYKWAEVLDADAFTKFASAGVVSRETGEHFRRTLLSRGDSADPEVLYEAFMGRPPSLDALLVRSGLA